MIVRFEQKLGYSCGGLPRITYLPWNKSIEVDPGTTVFGAAPRIGITIPTACNAKATCGLCRVRIVQGEEHLPPYSAVERKHLGNVYFISKLRLSCQLAVTGDVVVEVPDAQARNEAGDDAKDPA